MLRKIQSKLTKESALFATIKKRLCLTSITSMAFACSVALADNPLVSHVYSADPAVRYYDGRFWVMTSHDKDGATSYDLSDYFMFSSDDLINWQDHGIIFDARANTTWANQAYAPDWIKRNGKYYMIFPNGASDIGILEADNPEGPYTDLIGKALIDRQTPNSDVNWLFDPGVFVDDDNTMYVYFGGSGPGHARVIRLSDDLRSTVGAAISIDAPYYFEAPYMFKRNGTYYYSYSTNGENQGGITIDYMTSDNPTTGFTHKGTVIPNPIDNVGNNNHHSFVEVDDQWYAFYHTRAASGGSVYERSIAADRLHWNTDGTMQRVVTTAEGLIKIKNFDPFRKVEAETIDRQMGIETERNNDGSMHVQFDNNDWIRISNVDFQAGARLIVADVASNSNTSIDIRRDSPSGALLTTLNIESTGGLNSFNNITANLTGATGVQDIYFRANGRINLNWYEFSGEPKDCGMNSDGHRICCDMSADIDRNGWGEQSGEVCIINDRTNNIEPINNSDIVAAINVGSLAGNSLSGVYYQPDTMFTGGTDHTITDTIANSDNSQLFNSERYGDFSYQIPLEDGRYQVQLHLAEIYHNQEDARRFDISIEQETILNNFDLFSEVGLNTAYTTSVVDTHVLDGALTIDVQGLIDNGTLAGILVRKVDASHSSSSSGAANPPSSSGAISSYFWLLMGAYAVLCRRLAYKEERLQYR